MGWSAVKVNVSISHDVVFHSVILLCIITFLFLSFLKIGLTMTSPEVFTSNLIEGKNKEFS